MTGALDDEDDETKKTLSEIVFDYFPATINFLIMIALRNPYAFTAYTPPMGPKFLVKTAAKKIQMEQD